MGPPSVVRARTLETKFERDLKRPYAIYPNRPRLGPEAAPGRLRRTGRPLSPPSPKKRPGAALRPPLDDCAAPVDL